MNNLKENYLEKFIIVAGVIQIILGLVHITFPKKFNWKTELSGLSLINRQMMVVHTFFIALTVLLFGVLSLFYSEALLNSEFGRVISLGITVFWVVRLFFQFFVYSKELWKGKRFETMMHIIFVVTWIYLSAVYIISSGIF